jgi:hypothetical protein
MQKMGLNQILTDNQSVTKQIFEAQSKESTFTERQTIKQRKV